MGVAVVAVAVAVAVVVVVVVAVTFTDHTPFIFFLKTFHVLVASRPAVPCNNSRAALKLACETSDGSCHIGTKESF